MLHFEVDPRGPTPAYHQLMEQVVRYVAAGALAPGDRLPSIRDLARSLAVNPSTVVRAWGELEHMGVVERRQGRGVFVADRVDARGPEARAEALREAARSLAVEARQLGLPAERAAALVLEEYERLAPARPGANDPSQEDDR